MLGSQEVVQVAGRPFLVLSAVCSHLRELGYPEKSISSMLRCGQSSGFYMIKKCGCGVSLFPLIHHCNLRTCPACAKLHRRRVFARFLPFFNKFKVDKANFFQFLTISPPNYSTLEEGFSHIRKSWSKFIRRDYIKDRIKAGFYVLETTQADDGSYHIHIHCVMYGRWIDYRLRGKCLDCGQNLIKYDKSSMKYYCGSRRCNSFNVVVYDDTKVAREWNASAKTLAVRIYGKRVDSIYGAVDYLTKYLSVNEADFLSEKDMASYIFNTHKRKLINAFGLFHSIKMDKPVCICCKCHQEIEFIYDIDAVNILLQQPPPEVREKWQ